MQLLGQRPFLVHALHVLTLRLFVFFCFFVAFLSVWSVQQSSTWTLQAESMRLHGLQPEQIGVLNPVLIMILLPLFDGVIYPAIKKCGMDFTPLKRMGMGMLIGAAAFALSAGVEYKITAASQAKSVSVFWQLPQIVLISVGEILISVTGLEFAYTQAAIQLKSTVAALFLLTSAIGDLLTGVLYSALYPVLSGPVMLLFFSGLMLLNFVAFLYVASRYQPVIVVDEKVRATEEENETEEERLQKEKENKEKEQQQQGQGQGAFGAEPQPIDDLGEDIGGGDVELMPSARSSPQQSPQHQQQQQQQGNNNAAAAAAPHHLKRASTTSFAVPSRMEDDA